MALGDKGGRLSVLRDGGEELGVKGGTLGGGGVAAIDFGEELGGFGAVEVGLGFGGFGDVFRLGVGAVEPQGEYAVPVAGALVEGGDVAVEGEVVGAECEGLAGRAAGGWGGGEQEMDKGGEAGLGGGFSVCQSALGAGEGEVIPGYFGVVLGEGGEVGEGVEVFGGPGGRRILTSNSEAVEGFLRLGEAGRFAGRSRRCERGRSGLRGPCG